MARYDVHGHRNHGFDGYGMKETPYGAAIVGYSTSSETYSASTEQIVKINGYPYSNPAMHGQVWPRSSTHAQPIKGDDYELPYSPKFTHINGSPHDSPRRNFHRANSPPHGHHTGIHGSPHDSPRKNFHRANSPPHGHHTGIHGSPHDPPRKNFHGVNNPSHGHHTGIYSSPHDSPRKNFHRANSPPHGYHPSMYGNSNNSPRKNFRGNFSGTDDDSSEDEDVECRDGVCYPKPKQGQDNNKDLKKKGNRYDRKEAHHQTSEPKVYGKKPVTDAYYDRYAYPSNNEHTALAPIKTKPEGRNSQATHWTPFGGSPRKEVVESTEGQWRHGTMPSQSEHKYKRTIDSETLAKMYGGVFVK